MNNTKQRKKMINKLKTLKKETQKLQSKIIKEQLNNLKELNIRNIKIFGNTCNLIMPFVLTAGVTVGIFKLCGGGYPIKQDEIKKYKVYSLSKTSDNLIVKETYEKYINTPSSNANLTVYTPYEYIDNSYKRTVRIYKIKSNYEELYNAILNKDYDYISKNLNKYDEYIETTNLIEEENNYIYEAEINYTDSEDKLKYQESELKNAIISIIEFIITGSVGAVITKKREFDYLFNISDINYDYENNIVSIKPLKIELKAKKEQIKTLQRKIGEKK